MTTALPLEDRVCVLIGAGQGLGSAIATALSQEGARLVVADIREDLAQELASEVGGIGVAADGSRLADVERLRNRALDAHGRIDAVVDIVGVGTFGNVLDFTDDDWKASYDVNLGHAVQAIRVFGTHLAEQARGSMVFIGSISGISAAGYHAPYGTFKAALHGLVRAAAHELAPSNVRVNTVAPGFTATPRGLSNMSDADRQKVGRLGGYPRPADVAHLVTFLTTDRAELITGQTIIVDAGQSLRYPVDFPGLADG